MLVLLAALDWAIIHQRGLRFCYPISILWPRFSYPTSSVALRFTPPLRCAGAPVVRPCPSPVGRAQHDTAHPPRCARLTGFSHRVGAPTAQSSDPSLIPVVRCVGPRMVPPCPYKPWSVLVPPPSSGQGSPYVQQLSYIVLCTPLPYVRYRHRGSFVSLHIHPTPQDVDLRHAA